MRARGTSGRKRFDYFRDPRTAIILRGTGAAVPREARAEIRALNFLPVEMPTGRVWINYGARGVLVGAASRRRVHRGF